MYRNDDTSPVYEEGEDYDDQDHRFNLPRKLEEYAGSDKEVQKQAHSEDKTSPSGRRNRKERKAIYNDINQYLFEDNPEGTEEERTLVSSIILYQI